MQARHPTVLILGLCSLAIFCLAAQSAQRDKRVILFPSDLGPESIDVSDYPPELRRIYHDLLPHKCMTCHSLARVFNAPIAELSEEEEARARAEHPELFQDPEILKVGPESWKIYIKRMFMRPPCCGSCGIWTRDEIRQIHDFLRFDSVQRKTGAKAGEWVVLRKKLIKDFGAWQQAQAR